jgi:tryptophan synthase alpha chain
VLTNTSGFVYYVSITGITGTASASRQAIADAVARLRRHTDLPLAVGFGLKTAVQVAEVAELADAAVVGSAIVQHLAAGLDAQGKAGPGLVGQVLDFVRELAGGVRPGGKATPR